jgi:hypothetical protein
MQVSIGSRLSIRSCLFLCIIALLAACGGGGGGSGSTSFGGDISTPATNAPADGTLRPAVTDSPYKASIVNCVKVVNFVQVNYLTVYWPEN